MKNILIFVVIICGCFNVNSQNNLSPDEFNHDCFGATKLCFIDDNKLSFDFPSDINDCENQPKTRYFYFKASETLSLNSWGQIYTNTSTNLTIYGPFSNFNDGCNLINQFQAPIIFSSSQSNTNHQITMNSVISNYYIIELSSLSCIENVVFGFRNERITCEETPNCETCIPQFNPGPGKYIISAWVKQADANPLLTNYTSPSLNISFPSVAVTYSFSPSGKIIDGWQRIEGIFEVPSGSNDLSLRLAVDQVASFFDDVRIFPFDGSMLSYVYDPITLKLVAEMDERNYAKIYEYDEEGKLIRVKKETEKGIMTIQENRENSVKK